ncbi:DOPA 4,5-dioxygenase family protein [Curvivirga sp.]|uniref:DOPA 4,5-dioxygenase family protein n=1 Tax=Curvivirga sp. TaxID=2856848 RepID=UPI003B58B980
MNEDNANTVKILRDTSMYDYHAHIYFDEATKDIAWSIREQIEKNWPDIDMGRFWERNVGPHPRWSFQVAFHHKDFADITKWLMFNRKDLVVFLHPQSGDELADHRDHPIWMGEKLQLDLSMMEKKSR